MPANTVSVSFVSQFEREVHVEYQRVGAKLVNTVRRRTGIVGKDTTFQIYGSGEAGTKARGGKVPILNVPHSVAKLTLSDYYAGEYVERFDELKLIHEERQLAAQAVANAVGRKSDTLLIDEFDTAVTTNQTASAGAITLLKVEEIWEFFENNYVPDDNQRYGVVSPRGWTDLLALDEFRNRDYVPEAELPYRGSFMTMKRWHSFNWFTHAALNKDGSNIRTSMCYHRSALAFGSGSDTVVTPSWENDLQSWLIVAKLSQGAKMLDETGCYELLHTES